MKYPNLTLEQVESLVDKLGGMKGVQRILTQRPLTCTFCERAANPEPAEIAFLLGDLSRSSIVFRTCLTHLEKAILHMKDERLKAHSQGPWKPNLYVFCLGNGRDSKKLVGDCITAPPYDRE